eukprot:tig00001155_g7331.t1
MEAVSGRDPSTASGDALDFSLHLSALGGVQPGPLATAESLACISEFDVDDIDGENDFFWSSAFEDEGACCALPQDAEVPDVSERLPVSELDDEIIYLDFDTEAAAPASEPGSPSALPAGQHAPRLSVKRPKKVKAQPRRLLAPDEEFLVQCTKPGEKRVRTITYDAIEECFAMPVLLAARKLEVSLTTLKKISRLYGIHRWPGRKLRSLSGMRKAPESFTMRSGGPGPEAGRWALPSPSSWVLPSPAGSSSSGASPRSPAPSGGSSVCGSRPASPLSLPCGLPAHLPADASALPEGLAAAVAAAARAAAKAGAGPEEAARAAAAVAARSILPASAAPAWSLAACLPPPPGLLLPPNAIPVPVPLPIAVQGPLSRQQQQQRDEQAARGEEGGPSGPALAAAAAAYERLIAGVELPSPILVSAPLPGRLPSRRRPRHPLLPAPRPLPAPPRPAPPPPRRGPGAPGRRTLRSTLALGHAPADSRGRPAPPRLSMPPPARAADLPPKPPQPAGGRWRGWRAGGGGAGVGAGEGDVREHMVRFRLPGERPALPAVEAEAAAEPPGGAPLRCEGDWLNALTSVPADGTCVRKVQLVAALVPVELSPAPIPRYAARGPAPDPRPSPAPLAWATPRGARPDPRPSPAPLAWATPRGARPRPRGPCLRHRLALRRAGARPRPRGPRLRRWPLSAISGSSGVVRRHLDLCSSFDFSR